MKSRLIALSICLSVCSFSYGQYTPLPPLDHTEYEQFVNTLRTTALEQDMPELIPIADNMTYDEARRFMANPHVFADELKSMKKKEGDPAMDAIRIGIIVNFLMNHFTGLGSAYKSNPGIGFALGLYALYTFSTVYIITEIVFALRAAGEKYNSGSYNYTNTYRLGYAMLFSSILYAIELQKVKLLLGGGPVLGLALLGKQIYKENGQTDKSDIQFGGDYWKRFAAGIGLTVGIMNSGGMFFFLSYTLFLTKLYQNSDIRMNMFRLGMAFLFAKK
ncbi:MAG: outer membrane beta-barrel protein [Terrimonas sp.]|nr:outer membrane beta-barrel protein [Terrimonas sp.]